MTDEPKLPAADPPAKDTDETDSFPRLLADGLWVLGNTYFNLYLAKGEQAAALIEVGISAVVDEVVHQLESLKISPSFLVVTHPHADHVTGLDGLRERYRDALVISGEGAADFLSHPGSASALIAEDRHMSEYLASQGFKPGRPPVEDPPSLGESLIANDGDEIELGGLTLRFLTVKGHAPGSISAYIPELEALIASDSLGFRFKKSGFYPHFFTGFSDHLATLRRLEQLKVAILGIAHQGPRTGSDVPRSFEEARTAAVRLRQTILAGHRDADTIARELFEDSYKDELLLFSPENILACCRLLVRRANESGEVSLGAGELS